MRLVHPMLTGAALAASALLACAGPTATQHPRDPVHDAGASGAAATSEPRTEAEVIAALRGWWRAFTVADVAYLEEHSAPGLSLTLSSGRTYDRAGMLAQALAFKTGSPPEMEWTEEKVHFARRGVALVTSRLTETVGPLSNTFRYFTLLEQGSAGWHVTAAQSTREAAFTPRVPLSVVGALADFAGEYRTPRGMLLRVLAGEASLVLIEPSGKQLLMEPIGPALFEFKELSPGNGVVRFVFTRGRDGRITALSRLINGQVVSFPRVQSP